MIFECHKLDDRFYSTKLPGSITSRLIHNKDKILNYEHYLHLLLFNNFDLRKEVLSYYGELSKMKYGCAETETFKYRNTFYSNILYTLNKGTM